VTYTALAIIGVVAALALDLLVLRTRLVTRRAFWMSYAIIIVFQLISNGILTYREVVRYRPGAITGFRIAGAPFEDLLFGFSLVLQTLSWWVWWGKRLRKASGGEPGRPARALDRQPPDGA
jgi:lycopene cyclase domain-containing protein